METVFSDHDQKHKIVHLDFKGAPLKMVYLEKVLTAIKSNGATGVLIEWEDTFPYTGEIAEIGSNGKSNKEELYSIDEVKHILDILKEKKLKCIQLVQTIGHMEFVLKHPTFAELREIPESPAVLCPTKARSQEVLHMMIDQILDVQPDAEYIHIGADEVWHIALCPDCEHRANEECSLMSVELVFAHVRDVATYIKSKRPNINILIWDDMMRTIGDEPLKDYNLHKLVQPVVWQYKPRETFLVEQILWLSYRIFPAVWVASAFKGASRSNRMISKPNRYVSNQLCWLTEMKRRKEDINFAGIIITGWSRFDHYATLCEIMPVSMFNLAACLKTLKGDPKQYNIYTDAMPTMSPRDHWPFHRVVPVIRSLESLRERCENFIRGESVGTHMNPWQLERGFTNPLQLAGISKNARHLWNRLNTHRAQIYMQIYMYIGRRSGEEWLGTYVETLMNEMTKICACADSRMSVVSITPALAPGPVPDHTEGLKQVADVLKKFRSSQAGRNTDKMLIDADPGSVVAMELPDDDQDVEMEREVFSDGNLGQIVNEDKPISSKSHASCRSRLKADRRPSEEKASDPAACSTTAAVRKHLLFISDRSRQGLDAPPAPPET